MRILELVILAIVAGLSFGAFVASRVARRRREAIEPGEIAPPTPDRVAIRALALGAACGRAHLEVGAVNEGVVSREEAEGYRAQILAWVKREGLLEHLSEPEQEWLSTPIGGLSPEDTFDASWCSESLLVLLWALRSVESIPPYDSEVRTGELMEKLPPVGASTEAFIRDAGLRDLREIDLALEEAEGRLTRAKGAALADDVARRVPAHPSPSDFDWTERGLSQSTRMVSIARERREALRWLTTGSI